MGKNDKNLLKSCKPGCQKNVNVPQVSSASFSVLGAAENSLSFLIHDSHHDSWIHLIRLINKRIKIQWHTEDICWSPVGNAKWKAKTKINRFLSFFSVSNYIYLYSYGAWFEWVYFGQVSSCSVYVCVYIRRCTAVWLHRRIHWGEPSSPYTSLSTSDPPWVPQIQHFTEL